MNNKLFDKCLACGGELFDLNENYLQCRNCYLAISKKPAAPYDETYYYGKNGWTKDLIYRANLLFKLSSKFFKKDDAVLDFGSNLGIFVDVCNRNAYKADGCDISKKSIDLSKQLVKSDNFYLENELKNKYNVITAFDVIEHFEDVRDFFKKINNKLENNGLLIITTPNINSGWIKVFGLGWHGFGIPQYHRFIFSKKTFKYLTKNYNYQIIEYIETGILGKNGWRYALGSNYRLEKNKLRKLLKLPISVIKYLYLLISKKYFTDSIFLVLRKLKTE